MNQYVAHPCLTCGRPTRDRDPRCKPCRLARYARRQMTRDQGPVRLYNSIEWKRLAAEVVANAYECHWCHATGEKLTGDHIQPVSLYPALALVRSNVVAACRSCQVKRSWENRG